MCSGGIRDVRDALIKYFRKDQGGGKDSAVDTRRHERCTGNKDNDHFLSPLWPVQWVVRIVAWLWDEDNMGVSAPTMFKSRYVNAAIFLGRIAHDRCPRNMLQLMVLEDT